MGIGAGSIALLAAMPDARARSLVSANADRYEEYSGLTEAAVWRSIEAARETGHGITLEQVAQGYIGVGMAIRNDRGEAEAAVTVVGTIRRMTADHIEACLAAIRRHVETLGPIDLATRPL
jgi:DNA-binding IclR family transcriptional regulator